MPVEERTYYKGNFAWQVALLETNPYLLGLTIVVSIVHSIFEFLAFKNGKFNRTGESNVRVYAVVIGFGSVGWFNS